MCAQHPVNLPINNRLEDDYLLVEMPGSEIAYIGDCLYFSS